MLGENVAVWLVVNNHGVHLVVLRGDHGDLGQLMVGGGGGVAVHRLRGRGGEVIWLESEKYF